MDLASTYLSYLRYAQADDRGFHNFLSFQKSWRDEPTQGDSFGRALWSLGYTLKSAPYEGMRLSAKWLFDSSMNSLSRLTDLRAKSFSIIGLVYYLEGLKNFSDSDQRKVNKEEITQKIKLLADTIVRSYQKNRDDRPPRVGELASRRSGRQRVEAGWRWFENYLTYENARLPQSLLFAYKVIKDKSYLKMAQESLDFLIEVQYIKEKEYFSFIGQDGWYPKGGKKAQFDQQPVEAGSLVEVLCLMYETTREKKYLEFAQIAFEWFYGRNIAAKPLWDQETTGVKDGIIRSGVNLNQGGESLVSFLLAYLALKETLERKSD
ncbi:MAG: hypothetical protein A2Y57_01230 [Candidatus Woykebacteria bacterium RBG_13_40_7b]|uniref:Glycosyltransferase n=1 Tax=Candidatus Woykebacteria bacterium RBG_13_40_7b TaxID=1802594 RepID=A0A1G1WAF5_9BACT|nr:MAG: hypothetical protein A2Y57_01230 [Candidatus Woykebacteria bacterium RBG_13_40_7b]